jgi:two-component system, OmpR family, sensor kinase
VIRRRAGRGTGADQEQQLIDRAWRRMTVQTAAMFAAALLLLDLLAVFVVVQAGHAASGRLVAQALADKDALTSPPHDAWLYQRDAAGHVLHSPGAPPVPLDPAALAAGRRGDRAVHRGGREYLVRTEPRGAVTVQAALDITDQEHERHRLYLGLIAAGAVGLSLAILVGAVIARRSIGPLGLALARQLRFIADASHELRTPLTQLHTRAQLLDRALRRGGDPGRLAGDTEQLVRGTRHMADIVEDLLQAAQLRNAPGGFGPVDLAALGADALAAERPRAGERGIDLRVEAAPGQAYVVRGAATALRRVLTSLVDNALGHTGTGGHIVIELGRPSAAVVSCAVRDDGAGFDPADRQLMFERFARGGHGDRRRYGLGLALVQETVQAHGGSVSATGAPGLGATFTLLLPAWNGAGSTQV